MCCFVIDEFCVRYNRMKKILSLLETFLYLTLISCASNQAMKKEDITKLSPDKTFQSDSEPLKDNSSLPPAKLNKGGKSLRLVRVMEGGSCKNDTQGAKGVFLTYADPDDVERIKRERGSEIFANFEKQIQGFSLAAFDKAVKSTEIAIDPFALDTDDAQSKLFDKLAEAFKRNVNKDITAFEAKTSLTIDVIPFRRTFEFYINNCEATHTH